MSSQLDRIENGVAQLHVMTNELIKGVNELLGRPETSPPLVMRTPLVGDFLMLPQQNSPHILRTGYFGGSLVSLVETDRLDYLNRQRLAGAKHVLVMAHWIFRQRYFDNNWSGPTAFYAYQDQQKFGNILDECLSFGLSPVVVLYDRGSNGGRTITEVVDLCRQMRDIHGPKIAWMMPEFESDEIRSAGERVDLMRALRAQFSHCAIHFSSNMSDDAKEYNGLPTDVLIFGQASRNNNLGELRKFARETSIVASPRTIVNFEHSASENHSSFTYEEAILRADALAHGGWRWTMNQTSPRAVVMGICLHYDNSPIGLDAAWPELEKGLSGITRHSKDTIQYPGLPSNRRIDLGASWSSPPFGPWQWLEVDA